MLEDQSLRAATHNRYEAFHPVRVDTLEVLQLEHKDEPHERIATDVSNCTACYFDALSYTETVPLHPHICNWGPITRPPGPTHRAVRDPPPNTNTRKPQTTPLHAHNTNTKQHSPPPRRYDALRSTPSCAGSRSEHPTTDTPARCGERRRQLLVMGVTYQRLLSRGSQRPRGGAAGNGGGVRARAWVLLRWAAVRLSCAARRRYWCGGACARRLAWPGLCGRAASAAAPERRGKRSSVAAAAGGAGVVGYDSASYARNFDDGAWKDEEGVSWAGPGGGAFPRANPGEATTTTGDSDSAPSSAR
ncbi:hypothetical protein HU200_061783 [Digitaria exilis]|uniref:Uncharacterized protein n=1 Tax=Digitaria exilis TaxID=1010633 RepID=A0A835AAB9_9POAL|nr:hypothetical protein HU200_061783 [Digitaria exilis]